MEHIVPSNDSLERQNLVQSSAIDTYGLTEFINSQFSLINEDSTETNMNTTSLAENLLHLEGINDVNYSELTHNSEFKMLIDNSLVVTGTVTAPSFTMTSDRRTKTLIEPLSLAEYSVDNLNPVKFKFKTYERRAIETDGIGLIADELQLYYPFLVEGTQNGPYLQSVNYVGLIAVLIKEVKVLKPKVTGLEGLPGRVTTLEELPNSVETLSNTVKSLETLPNSVGTLSNSVGTLSNTVKSLELLPNRVQTVEYTTSTLNTTVNTLNSTVSTLNTTVSALNDRVNNISGIESLDALNNSISTLSTDVVTLSNSVGTLSNSVGTLEQELISIKSNHDALVRLLVQRNLINMEEYEAERNK